jgi:uncharacterized LabA/DUF88 family protein
VEVILHGLDRLCTIATSALDIGFALVTKQLKTIMQADGTQTQKANLDIEIVLNMSNTIDHYDMAMLVSGDGDFEWPLQLLRARAPQEYPLNKMK